MSGRKTVPLGFKVERRRFVCSLMFRSSAVQGCAGPGRSGPGRADSPHGCLRALILTTQPSTHAFNDDQTTKTNREKRYECARCKARIRKFVNRSSAPAPAPTPLAVCSFHAAVSSSTRMRRYTMCTVLDGSGTPFHNFECGNRNDS